MSLPDIDLPLLNFSPYRASQIKPIRNLISGYFLPYDFEQLNGEAFARNVAASFSGKTLQFEVTGAVNGVCLIVSCKKINDAIKRKSRKFCTELYAIKKNVRKRNKTERHRFTSLAARVHHWPSKRKRAKGNLGHLRYKMTWNPVLVHTLEDRTHLRAMFWRASLF